VEDLGDPSYRVAKHSDWLKLVRMSRVIAWFEVIAWRGPFGYQPKNIHMKDGLLFDIQKQPH
jgi:hypothetical protein